MPLPVTPGCPGALILLGAQFTNDSTRHESSNSRALGLFRRIFPGSGTITAENVLAK